jgi:ribosomal protein L37AE/L43A
MRGVVQALREVLGITIKGVEHTCPRCYSQNVKQKSPGQWYCTNCPWQGAEADTIGGNQVPAPTISGHYPNRIDSVLDYVDAFNKILASGKKSRLDMIINFPGLINGLEHTAIIEVAITSSPTSMAYRLNLSVNLNTACPSLLFIEPGNSGYWTDLNPTEVDHLVVDGILRELERLGKKWVAWTS